MKSICSLLTAMLICTSSFAQDILPFKWLIGTWEMPRTQGGFRLESWLLKDSNTLLGKGLKVIGTDTTVLETIEIRADGENVWYIPTVPDQNNAEAVPFKLVLVNKNQFVFENQQHDFPQRIVYTFVPVSKETTDVVTVGDVIVVDVVALNDEGIHLRFTRKK